MGVLIIAEAGVNHNGSIELAKQLIDAAVLANVDYVKFQTFKTEQLVSAKAKKASYQKQEFEDDSQMSLLKKLELKESDFKVLSEYCKEKGVGFLSTGFDKSSLNFIDGLGVDLYKIPSGELTNLPYLRQIGSFNKQVILSTGMATISEIKIAIAILEKLGISKENITALHCNTEYPTPMEDVNLLAMQHIAKEIGVKIGYSDHTLGIEVPIAAVALGATVIEKHFTLDRDLEGPDHKASLTPNELCDMVASIRNIEKSISGSGIKEPTESELKNKKIVRKSIHFAKDVEEGMQINDSDLIMLRPGDGISPMLYDSVIGKTMKKSRKAGEKLSIEDFVQ